MGHCGRTCLAGGEERAGRFRSAHSRGSWERLGVAHGAGHHAAAMFTIAAAARGKFALRLMGEQRRDQRNAEHAQKQGCPKPSHDFIVQPGLAVVVDDGTAGALTKACNTNIGHQPIFVRSWFRCTTWMPLGGLNGRWRTWKRSGRAAHHCWWRHAFLAARSPPSKRKANGCKDMREGPCMRRCLAGLWMCGLRRTPVGRAGTTRRNIC